MSQPMRNMRMLLLVSAVLISACGQKGALQQQAPAKITPNATETVQTDKALQQPQKDPRQ